MNQHNRNWGRSVTLTIVLLAFGASSLADTPRVAPKDITRLVDRVSESRDAKALVKRLRKASAWHQSDRLALYDRVYERALKQLENGEGQETMIDRLVACGSSGCSPLESLSNDLPPVDSSELQLVDAAKGMQPPVKINPAGPQYTELARQARVEGVVIVQAIIDQRGQVVSARQVKALPLGLTESAMRTVLGWRFQPATLDGRPVPVFYNVVINFRLR